ncbi:MAG: FAD-binding oxidoreductase [Bryobacteraceae bacterium]
MPAVRYGAYRCELRENESVLDGLLRLDAPVAHSCKAGSCGSCLLRAVEGEPPPQAQIGLKDSWKASKYFLACICHPDADLIVADVGDDARVPARIASLHRLAGDVLRVRLVSAAPFPFHPGQHVSLISDGAAARSYSIASLPEEGEIELHVRRVPNGRMSGWLFEQARPGTLVQIQGPSGECFYVPGREDQPLLLIGTGTGLAPLYGILRDALRRGHRGPVHLVHGALRPTGLYLDKEIRAIAAAHSHVEYTPSVLETDGPIDRVLSARFPKLAGWRGFVCGDPVIVQSLRRKLFLSGIAMPDILADAFLPAP